MEKTLSKLNKEYSELFQKAQKALKKDDLDEYFKIMKKAEAVLKKIRTEESFL